MSIEEDRLEGWAEDHDESPMMIRIWERRQEDQVPVSPFFTCNSCGVEFSEDRIESDDAGEDCCPDCGSNLVEFISIEEQLGWALPRKEA